MIISILGASVSDGGILASSGEITKVGSSLGVVVLERR